MMPNQSNSTSSSPGLIRISMHLSPFMEAWPKAIRPRHVNITSSMIDLVYSFKKHRTTIQIPVDQVSSQIRPQALGITSDLPPKTARALINGITNQLNQQSPQDREPLSEAATLIRLVENRESENDQPGMSILQTIFARMEDTERWRRISDAFHLLDDEMKTEFSPVLILSAFGAGENEEALSLWSRFGASVEANSNALWDYHRIAIYFMLGEMEKARLLLDNLALSPLDFDLSGVSELARCLGLPEKSLSYLVKFRLPQKDPALFNQNELFNLIVTANLAIENNETEIAQKLAIQALQSESISNSSLCDLADVLVRAEAAPAAIEALRRAYSGGASIPIGIKLAEIYLYTNQPEEVRKLTPALMEIEEIRFEATTMHAASFVLSEEPAAAIALFQALLEEEPRNQVCTLWITQAYFLLDLNEDAQGYLERFDKKITGEHPVGKLLGGMCRPGDKTNYKHRFILRKILSTDFAFDSMSPEEETALCWKALHKLGGNRSTSLTVLNDRSSLLSSMPDLTSARVHVVKVQHEIFYKKYETVREDLAKLAIEYPDVPYPNTYRAELALWYGDYETAEKEFSHMWATTATRWAYVGSGAAMILQGRCEEGLARFEDAFREYSVYIAGEATLGYRGEAHMYLNNYSQALLDLEKAIELRPLRLGCRVSLGLLYAKMGRLNDAGEIIKVVIERCPQLFWEAHLDLGLKTQVIPDKNKLELVLTKCLELLRGNRSTHLITFFDASGEWNRLCIHQHFFEVQRLCKRLDGVLRNQLLQNFCRDGRSLKEILS